MGIWRFAGAFAVVERQSECGSKTAGMHVSQPMNIERVLWPVVSISFSNRHSLSPHLFPLQHNYPTL